MIRALREGRALVRSGTLGARAILSVVRQTLRREARPDAVDYLALVDSTTLEPIERLDRAGGFILGAIRIGRTRLIDNLLVKPPLRRAGGG